ncbi:MAG TPA: NUDIX hydrolase [Ktedonobacterales bacterium]|nr:NUDIX hydrolase [Ktedonobacterales bacterium]
MPHVTYTIAAALLRRDDEILLVRQQGADDPHPRWALPGGVAEQGELLHEALARELREETGITLVRMGSLAYIAQMHIMHGLLRGYPGAAPEEYVATAYVCEVAEWRGELASEDPDGFVSDARFFPLADAIALLDQLAYRVMREPAVAYLRGEVPSGAVWLYRRAEDGADTLLERLG